MLGLIYIAPDKYPEKVRYIFPDIQIKKQTERKKCVCVFRTYTELIDEDAKIALIYQDSLDYAI